MAFRNPLRATAAIRYGTRTFNAEAAASPSLSTIPTTLVTLVIAGADCPSGTVAEVHATCDFDHQATGAGQAVGELYLDGTKQDPALILTLSNGRATVHQQWLLELGLLGPGVDHTLELKGRKQVSAGNVIARATHTNLMARLAIDTTLL